jgi:hypothetical protein
MPSSHAPARPPQRVVSLRHIKASSSTWRGYTLILQNDGSSQMTAHWPRELYVATQPRYTPAVVLP